MTTESNPQLKNNATNGIIHGMMDDGESKTDMTTQRTRRLNHHGTLIRKPNGLFIAKWHVGGKNGKTYYRSTQERDRNRALKRLEDFTKSLREDSLIDTLKALQAQIERLQAGRSREALALDDISAKFEAEVFAENIAESTMNGYRSAIAKMVAWMRRQGARTAGDITKAMAGDYLHYLINEVGANTYNIRLVLFKRVWGVLRDYDIQADTWAEYKKQTGAAKKTARRDLSAEEVARVMAAITDPDLKLLFTIGLYTGMRKGDCACLKWEAVDFAANTITVIPQKTKRHGITITIPMHSELATALKAAKLRSTGEYVSAKNAHDYASKQIDRAVKALFESCGIETSRKDEKGRLQVITGFHSLRHTCASMMANAGVPLAIVAKLLGHSSEKMTEHYTHADMSKLAEGIANLKVA